MVRPRRVQNHALSRARRHISAYLKAAGIAVRGLGRPGERPARAAIARPPASTALPSPAAVAPPSAPSASASEAYGTLIEDHCGFTALPCLVGDPDRKGKVEAGVGHAQKTPLKGLRFETLESAQTYFDRWEARWARVLETRLDEAQTERLVPLDLVSTLVNEELLCRTAGSTASTSISTQS